MMTVFIILFGVATACLGKAVFRFWFNHVSLYAAIWTSSLLLFQLRLLHYYPLQPETWLLIFGAWIAFVCGSLCPPFARHSLVPFDMRPTPASPQEDEAFKRVLKIGLWITCLISLAVTLQHWSVVLHKFGSIKNVIVFGGLVYKATNTGELPGQIPYVSPLYLVGCFFGGTLVRLEGKLSLLVIFPIVLAMMDSFAMMNRGAMILAFLLFLSGYFIRQMVSGGFVQASGSQKLKRALAIIMVFALLACGMEFVRSNRAMNEKMDYASKELKILNNASFITPSVYMYLTVHFGVLNEYLKRGTEDTPIGSNTFAILYHVLGKMGIVHQVQAYPDFYHTPVLANTGLYIRELDADFGLVGAIAGPFFLGLVTSYWWLKNLERRRLLDALVLSYFITVTCMTLFDFAVRYGNLLVFLVAGLIVTKFFDRLLKRAQAPVTLVGP